jgi:hypothetical protein
MKVIPFTTETLLAEKILREAANVDGDHSKYHDFMRVVVHGLSEETFELYSKTWYETRRLYHKRFSK